MILLGKDGNDRTTTLQTHDGGMTWTWDSIQASDSNTLDLPEEAAAWVNTYLSAQYTVLDTQTFDFDGNNYILLLVGSENPSVTGYQVFALEQNDGAYVLYAWNESYGWDSSLEDIWSARCVQTHLPLSTVLQKAAIRHSICLSLRLTTEAKKLFPSSRIRHSCM